MLARSRLPMLYRKRANTPCSCRHLAPSRFRYNTKTSHYRSGFIADRVVINNGAPDGDVAVVLLVVLLAVCSSFPTSSPFNTCGSGLWTAHQVLHYRAGEPCKAEFSR